MSSPEAPRFTVIMATWNRGRHILPSIRSVLAQDFRNFELLVIGDAATDDTGEIVEGIGDPRVRWINLTERWFTQSGPNNRGNEEARGEIIAYIGHDDIWAPDHLSALLDAYATTNADVVSSGVVFHPQPADGAVMILGLGEHDFLTRNFTPPTGLSHRRSVWRQIGGWQPRDEARGPVDGDFEIRMVEAGFQFASTGKITAHKFTSSARYLSYLVVRSDEQEAALLRLSGGHTQAARAWVADVERRATVRSLDLIERTDPSGRDAHTELTMRNRGLELPPLQMLKDVPLVIPQDGRPRVGQWRPLEWLNEGFRWTEAGVAANLLVPVASDVPAKLSVDLCLTWTNRRAGLQVSLNGEPANVTLTRRHFFAPSLLRAVIPAELYPDRHSVLTFAIAGRLERRTDRIGVGTLTIEPA